MAREVEERMIVGVEEVIHDEFDVDRLMIVG